MLFSYKAKFILNFQRMVCYSLRKKEACIDTDDITHSGRSVFAKIQFKLIIHR